MDQKIFKYKRALAVDFYVLTPEVESIQGDFRRNKKGSVPG